MRYHFRLIHSVVVSSVTSLIVSGFLIACKPPTLFFADSRGVLNASIERVNTPAGARLSAHVTGGTPPYQFLWKGPGGESISNENEILIPLGSGSQRELHVTDASGSVNVALLWVSFDPPSIGVLSDQIVPEDSTLGPISFGVSDPDSPAESLVVSASSSNPTLVAPSGIVVSGTGGQRTLTVRPEPQASGASTISLIVSDGTVQRSTSFLLSVTAVNDPPVISLFSSQTIPEDQTLMNIPFMVGDVDNEPSNLGVTVESSNPVLIDSSGILISGVDSNRFLSLSPKANQFGVATLTLRVSDGNAQTPTTFSFVVTAVNDAPSISFFSSQTTLEDTTLGPINFTVTDIDSALPSLTVTASSTNTALIPIGNVLFSGSGANRTLSIIPAANLGGSSTIVVTVSDGLLQSSSSFQLSVVEVNDPPTVSMIAPVTIPQNAVAGPLAFIIGDPDSFVSDLVLSGSSNNPQLVANSNIVFGGSGSSRNVTVTPTANQSGTASISVRVTDGQLASTITSFTLTVTAPGLPPTISTISNQTIPQGSSTAALPFTIADSDTAVGNLTLSVNSSNQALVPNSNLVIQGSGASRSITVTPLSNQNGVTTITVTVSDGSASTPTSFTLTVSPSNTPPTITGIVNQNIQEDTTTAALPFSIFDNETSANNLNLSKSSSNTALFPVANIILGGADGNRTVTLTPTANQSGSATISITVSDGALQATSSFLVTVAAVNDPPTITSITDQTINEDNPTSALTFTVGDQETAPSLLTVTKSSSNSTLVPTGSIVISGSGANKSVIVTPAGNQSGSSLITLTVSDGVVQSSSSFQVTVLPINDVPTISAFSPVTVSQGSGSAPLSFVVSDVELAAGALQVSGSSSNAVLIPPSSFVFGGSGGNRTLTITPPASQFGVATITVSVSDGSSQTPTSFFLTVTQAPTLVGSISVSQITANALFSSMQSVIQSRCQNCHSTWASYQEQSFFVPRTQENKPALAIAGNPGGSPMWSNLSMWGGGSMPSGMPSLSQSEARAMHSFIMRNVWQLSGSASGGVPPYNYSWSDSPALRDGSRLLNDLVSASVQATPLASTNFTLQITDRAGNSTTVSSTVNVSNTLVVNAGSDRSIRPGNSTMLQAIVTGGVQPLSYQWSPPTGLSTLTSATPTAAPSVTTTYTVTVTDSALASATDSVVVTVDPNLPNAYLASSLRKQQAWSRGPLKSLVDSIFDSSDSSNETELITQNYIQNHIDDFGFPCDPYLVGAVEKNGGGADCLGDNERGKASMIPASNVIREAYRFKMCAEILDQNLAVSTAVSKISGASTSSRPSQSQIMALFKLFHRGKNPPQSLTSALLDIAQSSSLPNAFEAWRLVLFTSCIDPTYQIMN